MSLPTGSDHRLHLNMSSTQDDDELADVLDAAIDVVAGIVGPIEQSTVTETHRATASDTLLLRRMPVGSLTSISSRSGSTVTPLTLGDYELDVDAGLLRSANGYGFLGDYVVTYTTGRDALPAAMRLAVLIVAAHLWETQRGAAPVGPLSQQDEYTGTNYGMGFAIPNRARELLAPYVRPVIA